MTQPNYRLVASLLLVDLAILVLVLGHFVQLNGSSGGDQWNLPLGLLAGGLGLAALVVAVPDAAARRALGIVLVGGVAVLVVLRLTLGDFRFIWAADEFELAVLEVVLVCIGLILVATGSRRPVVETQPGILEPAPMSWQVRTLLYLAIAVALVFVAGLVGASYGDAQCTGEGDDCPEAIIAMLLGAFGALVGVVTLITTCELTLWSRRRRTEQ